MKKKINIKKGFGLTEIVVGSAIIASVLVAAVTTVSQIIDLDRKTTSVIRANYLLLEGIDVTKILRDNSWSTNIATLTQNTPYYLVWESGSWFATSTPNIIDGTFYRTISFDAVNRDANDNIATIGVLDAGTLHLTSTVEWNYKGSTTTKVFETYITDLYGN